MSASCPARLALALAALAACQEPDSAPPAPLPTVTAPDAPSTATHDEPDTSAGPECMSEKENELAKLTLFAPCEVKVGQRIRLKYKIEVKKRFDYMPRSVQGDCDFDEDEPGFLTAASASGTLLTQLCDAEDGEYTVSGSDTVSHSWVVEDIAPLTPWFSVSFGIPALAIGRGLRHEISIPYAE